MQSKGDKSVEVYMLWNSGSRMRSISEESLAKMRDTCQGGRSLVSFKRPSRDLHEASVGFRRASMGVNGTLRGERALRLSWGRAAGASTNCSLFLMLLTPRDNVPFQMPFVIFPGPGCLAFIGQMALRKILSECDSGSEESSHWLTEHHLFFE